MKTKYVFLTTFLMGLVWTGFLFAHAIGPDPGVNGVFGPTCNQVNCHVGNPVNAAPGSVVIEGLPPQWTPGQTYPITVTVSRAGTIRYGFQFSSVVNATNQQAGSITAAVPNNIRVQIITAQGIQYAQHNTLASTNGIFTFNWTAPSSAAVGRIRFNAAGNATNGNGANTGDFIYTTVVMVDPAAGDLTPPVISGVTATGITTSGGTVNWTTDEDSTTQLEYGTTTAYGQTTTLDPAGVMAHSATLSGLAGVTTYHYRARSRDAAGNTGTSTDFSFITPYSISNLGGLSRATDGSGGLLVGYSRILPDAANTTPSGVAIYGFRPAGVLVTEAGVPDAALITSGRIYGEVTSDVKVNTGLAIANPNNQPANITFTLTGTNGVDIKTDSFVVAPNTQIASFLNEAPYQSGVGFQGTMSFTSNVGVGVVALRQFQNERNEALFTTLPVVDTAASPISGTQVIPHFAAGGGWTTQIILVNPTSGAAALTGSVQFLDRSGQSINVTIGGQSVNNTTYSVATKSSQKITVTSPTANAGTVRIVPSGGGVSPTPLVIFTYKPAQFTTSEAGVPVTVGTALRFYVEKSAVPNIDSGFAIANTTTTAGSVTLQLTALDGSPIVTSPSIPLPASGQVVGFLGDFLPNLTLPLKGVLRVTTTTGGVSVVALRQRYNEIGDYLVTTTPPTNENVAASATQRLFPHFVNGQGYTTQFILFSGTAGQAPSGTLGFQRQDGATAAIDIR